MSQSTVTKAKNSPGFRLHHPLRQSGATRQTEHRLKRLQTQMDNHRLPHVFAIRATARFGVAVSEQEDFIIITSYVYVVQAARSRII